MLHWLPAPLLGAVTFLLMTLNTLILCGTLFVCAFIKFLLPIPAIRHVVTGWLTSVASLWVKSNNAILQLTQKIEWDVAGLEKLDKHHWYLLTANHQSWVDILVLQKISCGHIPFLKFFLKKQLIWVPVLGLAWWALDFPFMQRFSREALAKNPQLRDKDRKITEQACARFASRPTTIMNFIEGTRFTQAKHNQQQSPFQHLLKPKAGGFSFALGAMGEKIHSLIDVTIVYRENSFTFWDLLSGKLRKITVRVAERKIPPEFFGKDYNSDEQFKAAIQLWLTNLWLEKDALIQQLKMRN